MPDLTDSKPVSLPITEKRRIANEILAKDANAILGFQQKPEGTPPTVLGHDQKRHVACDAKGDLTAKGRELVTSYLASAHLQPAPRAGFIAVMEHQTKRDDAAL